MPSNNLNIKNALETDQDFIRQLAKDKDLTMAAAFSLLVKAYQNPAGSASSEVNNPEQENQINELKARLEALTEQKNTENEARHTRIQELETQLQETTEALQNTKEAAPKFPAFIFNPGPLQRNMQRSIIFLIKKGKLKKTDADLPQQFTYKAVDYFMRNEFSEALK